MDSSTIEITLSNKKSIKQALCCSVLIVNYPFTAAAAAAVVVVVVGGGGGRGGVVVAICDIIYKELSGYASNHIYITYLW